MASPTVSTEAKDPHKTHNLGENEACVSDGALSMTDCGEPAVTTGYLGLGKLMPTNTSGSPDAFISGEHKSDGYNMLKSLDDETSET